MTPSRNDILRPALHDATVAAAVALFNRREIAWEDAMHLAVAALVEQNRALQASLVNRINHTTGPFTLYAKPKESTDAETR